LLQWFDYATICIKKLYNKYGRCKNYKFVKCLIIINFVTINFFWPSLFWWVLIKDKFIEEYRWLVDMFLKNYHLRSHDFLLLKKKFQIQNARISENITKYSQTNMGLMAMIKWNFVSFCPILTCNFILQQSNMFLGSFHHFDED
jgi:hypothetical protein